MVFCPAIRILTIGDLPAKSRVIGSSPSGRSAGESAIPTRPSRRHPSRPQARATRGAPEVAPSPPDWGLGRRWPGGLGRQRSRPHRWGPALVLLPDGRWYQGLDHHRVGQVGHHGVAAGGVLILEQPSPFAGYRVTSAGLGCSASDPACTQDSLKNPVPDFCFSSSARP